MTNCIHNQHVTGKWKTPDATDASIDQSIYNLYSDLSIKHLYPFLHYSLSLFLCAYGIVCVMDFTLSANQRMIHIRIVLEPYERGWRDKIALRVCVRVFV